MFAFFLRETFVPTYVAVKDVPTWDFSESGRPESETVHSTHSPGDRSGGKASTPAANYLFKIREGSVPIEQEKADLFHKIVMQF